MDAVQPGHPGDLRRSRRQNANFKRLHDHYFGVQRDLVSWFLA
jgi:hypothetical protein